MTEHDTPSDAQQQPSETAPVSGGGGASAAELLASDPVRNAAAKLELLSEETREQVLGRMPAEIAQRIRDHIASQPANRPHGDFSTDVATRRQLIHEMADSVATRRTSEADAMTAQLAPGMPVPEPVAMASPPLPSAVPGMPAQPRAATGHPLDELRNLHPAAIARAMQGERAEAWAIVLDRLDYNAKAALQLYLDGTARTAIEEARARQAELEATSPALLATVVAAIARTVVPRAMREHHGLLTTTPLAWSGS